MICLQELGGWDVFTTFCCIIERYLYDKIWHRNFFFCKLNCKKKEKMPSSFLLCTCAFDEAIVLKSRGIIVRIALFFKFSFIILSYISIARFHSMNENSEKID